MFKNVIFSFNGHEYKADLNRPIDISLPLRQGEDNPNCYWAEPVAFETIEFGDFTGDVAMGGSCNYKKVIITPHGNGTHTECYGHISPSAEATINNCLKDFLFTAQLITIIPEKLSNGDKVITTDSIKQAFSDNGQEAVIIRILPNDEQKKLFRYSGSNPPYFLPEVMDFFVDKNIHHLLVDLPSLDREEDGGKLAAHHKFWRYPEAVRRNCTVTELVYVENYIKDGMYLLNLQITSLELDVSPSKPVLYQLLNK